MNNTKYLGVVPTKFKASYEELHEDYKKKIKNKKDFNIVLTYVQKKYENYSNMVNTVSVIFLISIILSFIQNGIDYYNGAANSLLLIEHGFMFVLVWLLSYIMDKKTEYYKLRYLVLTREENELTKK